MATAAAATAAPPGSAARSRRRRRAGGTSSSSATAASAAVASRSASSATDFATDDCGFIGGGSATATTATSTSTLSSSNANIAASSSTAPPATPAKKSTSCGDGTKSQSAIQKSSIKASKPPKTVKKKSGRSNQAADQAAGQIAAAIETNSSVIEEILRNANQLCGKLIPSSTLLRTIARASAASATTSAASASASPGISDQQIEGGLLLEEKLGDVLSIVKKCLRAAMSSSSGSSGGGEDRGKTPSKTPRKDKTSDKSSDERTRTTEALSGKIAHLRVAIHSLRAIYPIVVGEAGGRRKGGGTKKEGQLAENTARLLYHAIIASEDAFIDAQTDGKEDNEAVIVRSDAACLCLASCSILSSFLAGFDASSSRLSWSELKSPLLVNLAHTPTENLGDVGGMTAVQVAKIGAQSLLSSSTVLSSLFLDSFSGKLALKKQREDKVADEFGFAISDVLGRGSGSDEIPRMTTTTTLPPFQALVRTAASWWLLALVNDASKEGIDGALSYSKRFQRMLWDCAARVDKNASSLGKEGASVSYMRRLSLGLRGDSITASLLAPCDDREQLCNVQAAMSSTSELQRAFLEDRLEYACGCGWKAAVSYSQSATSALPSDPTWYGALGRSEEALSSADRDALQVFHCKVGTVIDELVQTRLGIMEGVDDAEILPFSYIEYCAYRALHIGPDRRYSEDKMEEEHNDKENSSDGIKGGGRGSNHKCNRRCKQSECLYSSLPFAFVHGHGHLRERSNSSKDDAASCGTTTLCLFFAALQAYDCVIMRSEQWTGAEYESGDALISAFSSSLLTSNNGRRPKLSVVLQCQKMLASLKLPSRAMHVIKAFEQDEARIEGGTIRAIGFVQRVLGECYAPLLTLIASAEKVSAKSEGKASASASRLEMAQDSYIRAAMLSDHLCEWTSSSHDNKSHEEFTASADKALRRVFQLASGSSEGNMAMVARSIGAIGKQRYEREVRALYAFTPCMFFFVSNSQSYGESNFVPFVSFSSFVFCIIYKDMESAITPMLLSTELFASLFESSRSPSYKLPVRYQHIASLFESINMPNKAIVALVLALHYQLREAQEERTAMSSTDEIILRCVESIDGGEGPFVPSERDTSASSSHQILVRLVRTFAKHCRPFESGRAAYESDASKIDKGKSDTLVDTLKRSRIGKTIDKALSLEEKEEKQGPLPIYRIFQLLIARSSIEGLDIPAQVNFLTKALFFFGKSLTEEISRARENIGNDECKEPSLWIDCLSSEFTGFLKLALTCASKGRETMSELQFRKYEAAAYLCASVSFFLNRPTGGLSDDNDTNADLPNLMLSALKYAKKATTLLEFASRGLEDENDRILLEVQQLAVDYYVSDMSRAETEELEEPSCHEHMLSRVENSIAHIEQYNREAFGNMAACLVFILAKMQSKLDFSGNSPAAVRSAALIARLQRSASTKTETHPSSEALALSNLGSTLIDGGFHGACRMIVHDFVQRGYGCTCESFDAAIEESARKIFAKQDVSTHEIDLLALSLLAQVQSSYLDRLDVTMQLLQDVIEMVGEYEDCDDASTWIQVRWIQSTCLFALAQGMEKCGSVEQALAYYKGCSRTCRSAMAFVQSLGPCAVTHNSPSTNLALCTLKPANMTHRFTIRLSQSLRDASKLYCRQGDYSRGEGYALSLVETLRALPDTSFKISKSSTDDLCLLLTASASGSVRRAEALHFLIEILALSRDADMVSSELGRKKSLVGSKDQNGPEWALQNVRSMMSCKFETQMCCIQLLLYNTLTPCNFSSSTVLLLYRRRHLAERHRAPLQSFIHTILSRIV